MPARGERHGVAAGRQVAGYCVVHAEPHDAAAKIFGRTPAHGFEMVEIMPMPGDVEDSGDLRCAYEKDRYRRRSGPDPV